MREQRRAEIMRRLQEIKEGVQHCSDEKERFGLFAEAQRLEAELHYLRDGGSLSLQLLDHLPSPQ